MLGIVIVGLTTGGVYALSALGLVSIFRGSKVLNFALGAFAGPGVDTSSPTSVTTRSGPPLSPSW